MGSLADAYEVKVLDAILGNNYASAAGIPATVYIALSTTTPTDAGGNFTEPSGNAYARVTSAQNATNWPAAATVGGVSTKSNGIAVAFPLASGSWGTVTYFGIYDAVSAGSIIIWGILGASLLISTGDTPTFAIGALAVTLD